MSDKKYTATPLFPNEEIMRQALEISYNTKTSDLEKKKENSTEKTYTISSLFPNKEIMEEAMSIIFDKEENSKPKTKRK